MGQTEFITQTFSALCFLAAGLVFAGRLYSSAALPNASDPIAAQTDQDTAGSRWSPVSRWQSSTSLNIDSNLDQAKAQPGQSLLSEPRQGIASVLPTAQLAVSRVSLANADGGVNTTADAAVVDLGDRRVYLYQGEQLLVDYAIAVGRRHWETPTGEFQVIEKQENPVWRHPFTRELVPPGATNPLGTHWVGFWTNGTHQIGFHGTNDTEAIGQAVSHGCIRMRNGDVQALYALMPLGSTVTVRH